MKICSSCYLDNHQVVDISNDIVPPIEIHVDCCPGCREDAERLAAAVNHAVNTLGIKEATKRFLSSISKSD